MGKIFYGQPLYNKQKTRFPQAKTSIDKQQKERDAAQVESNLCGIPSSYACSIGRVLISTSLTSHTAPCMTVGSTRAQHSLKLIYIVFFDFIGKIL